jgi:succinyl-CoA synthetase beta subunit
VQAARDIGTKVPLVVRLAGTNVEEGQRIIRESGLPIITADSLSDAAERVVAALKGARAQSTASGNGAP